MQQRPLSRLGIELLLVILPRNLSDAFIHQTDENFVPFHLFSAVLYSCINLLPAALSGLLCFVPAFFVLALKPLSIAKPFLR